MKREASAARDAEIFEMFKSGLNGIEIASKLKMTPQNVYRILRKFQSEEEDSRAKQVASVKDGGVDNSNESKSEEESGVSKYESIGREIGSLVSEKQAAYGDSFSKSVNVLKELYPEIPVAQLKSMLTVVRVVDKLFRIATNRDAFGEDPWRDVAGYALLEVVKRSEEKE